MNLYTDKGNLFSLELLAACHITNTDVNYHVIDKKDSISGLTGKLPGKLPYLEVEPGKFLFSHLAATRYVFNKSKSENQYNHQESKIDELVEWDSEKVKPVVLRLLAGSILKKDIAPAPESVEELFSTLEPLLENREFLVGSSFSAADVALWGSFYCLMNLDVSKMFVSKYGNVSRWFTGLSSKDAFRNALNSVTGKEGILAFRPFLETYRALSNNSKTEESGDQEISFAQIKLAKQEWENGLSDVKPRVITHPILPKKGEKNIMISAALPYVNNVPHLGNIIGCVLSADVYARYCRLRNYNSLFISGTDEYGTATETKAIAEGLTPQEICDKYNKIHNDIYKWFNIQFDYFGRTSTQKQTEIAQDIFWKIHREGNLLEDNVEQLHCTKCQMFLADRFVEGTCPMCKFEDARGDQCDACGKLINATELIDPKCKQCKSSPQIKTSRHIFLDLPKVEPQLREWLKKMDEDNWTHNARTITRSWLGDGLRQRCITRDLKWGTPVPLEGFTDKVFYVWFDAPIGYISITANYTDEWEKWWKNPEEVRYIEFMAKDNVPFHSVVFPSSLIATKENWTLVNELIATEYLNYEDDKFSKSRGVGVFGDHAESTGIPADIFRYYLLCIRPEGSDASFQWADLVMRNNQELLGNLGNFLNRALMFLKNSFNSTMPQLHLTDDDYALVASVNRDLRAYVEHLEKSKLRAGLRFILNISRAGNQYIQSNQPWVLAKGSAEDKIRAGTVIGLSVNISALLAILLQPYMPDTSVQIQKQLEMPADLLIIPEYFAQLLPAGHTIGTPYPLFKKIETQLGEELRAKFAGVRDDTKPVAKNGTPNGVSKPEVNGSTAAPGDVVELENLVKEQGDAVRKAKGDKLPKDVIDGEVKKLLALKEKLAIAQGIDPSQMQKGKKQKKK